MEKKYLYGVALVVIAAAVLLLVLGTFLVPTASSQGLPAYDNLKVPQSILSEFSISDSISNQIGIGLASRNVKSINGNPTYVGGKPEVLYIGAEYCPFCAAERWGMIIALMRFGNFSNLHFMTSSKTDYAPSTPTFTFYNSSYYSPYISFVSVEQTTNNMTPLQQPNASEAAVFGQNDPSGGIPFIFFANKTVMLDANYDPKSVLGGRNWTEIAQQLSNASSLQAQSIVGTADLITAQICQIDNNSPSDVCSQPYVKAVISEAG